MIDAGATGAASSRFRVPTLALGEQGQGAVLGGEEDEHDRHRRAIERGTGRPGACRVGQSATAIGLARLDGRLAGSIVAWRRPGRRSPPRSATASWTAPMSSANRVTTARATSRARRARTRQDRGSRSACPLVTASRESGRDDDRRAGPIRVDLVGGGGLVGRRSESAMPGVGDAGPGPRRAGRRRQWPRSWSTTTGSACGSSG